MHSAFKFYLLIFNPVVCCLLILTMAVYYQHNSNSEVSPLEPKVDQIPLGTTRREVRKLKGSRHVATSQITGIIFNQQILRRPLKLVARFGPPQDYSIRIWKQDGMQARIAFNKSGKVVCRSIWYQSARPRHQVFDPYSIFKHLRRIFLV